METTLGQRIRSAARKRELTMQDIATRLGVSYETVRKWVNDQTAPTRARFPELAALLGVPEFELRYGFAPTGVAEPAPPVYQVTPGASMIDIPLYDAPASMGQGALMPEMDAVIGGIRLSVEWVRHNVPTTSAVHNLAVIPAYGDSMTPTFSDGDLLLVDRGVTNIRIDAVYVLGLNGELFIKRLQRRPDGAILMISDNRAYEPYHIENGDREQFAVLGRVVFAWNGKKL